MVPADVGGGANTLAARLFCDNTVSMARQTVLSQKKRGPAPTGKGTLIGVRLQPAPLSELDAWAARQDDTPSRPEAIRRLVELGLLAKDSGQKPAREPGSRAKHAAKAANMAGQEIDRRTDLSAPTEEQARRKRRLIKGPGEFREIRDQSRKPKGSG
jgi:hypothetical protein